MESRKKMRSMMKNKKNQPHSLQRLDASQNDGIYQIVLERLVKKLDETERELKFAWQILDILNRECSKIWEKLGQLEDYMCQQQNMITGLLNLHIHTGVQSTSMADQRSMTKSGIQHDDINITVGDHDSRTAVEEPMHQRDHIESQDCLEERVLGTALKGTHGIIEDDKGSTGNSHEVIDIAEEKKLPDEAFYRSLNNAHRNDFANCHSPIQASQLGMIWEEGEDVSEGSRKVQKAEIGDRKDLDSGIDYGLDHICTPSETKLSKSLNEPETNTDNDTGIIFSSTDYSLYCSGISCVDEEDLMQLSKLNLLKTPQMESEAIPESSSSLPHGDSYELVHTNQLLLESSIQHGTDLKEERCQGKIIGDQISQETAVRDPFDDWETLHNSRPENPLQRDTKGQASITDGCTNHSAPVDGDLILLKNQDAIKSTRMSRNLDPIPLSERSSEPLEGLPIDFGSFARGYAENRELTDLIVQSLMHDTCDHPNPYDMVDERAVSAVHLLENSYSRLKINTRQLECSEQADDSNLLNKKNRADSRSESPPPPAPQDLDSPPIYPMEDSQILGLDASFHHESTRITGNDSSMKILSHTKDRVLAQASPPTHKGERMFSTGLKTEIRNSPTSERDSIKLSMVCSTLYEDLLLTNSLDNFHIPQIEDEHRIIGDIAEASDKVPRFIPKSLQKSRLNGTHSPEEHVSSFMRSNQMNPESVKLQLTPSQLLTKSPTDLNVADSDPWRAVSETYRDDEFPRTSTIELVTHKNTDATRPVDKEDEIVPRCNGGKIHDLTEDRIDIHGYEVKSVQAHHTREPVQHDSATVSYPNQISNITDTLSYYPIDTVSCGGCIINLNPSTRNQKDLCQNSPMADFRYSGSEYIQNHDLPIDVISSSTEAPPSPVCIENRQGSNGKRHPLHRENALTLEGKKCVPGHRKRDERSQDGLSDPAVSASAFCPSTIIISHAGYISISGDMRDDDLSPTNDLKKFKRGSSLKNAMNSVSSWLPDLHSMKRHRSYSLPGVLKKKDLDPTSYSSMDGRHLRSVTHDMIQPDTEQGNRKKKKHFIYSAVSGMLQKVTIRARSFSDSESLVCDMIDGNQNVISDQLMNPAVERPQRGPILYEVSDSPRGERSSNLPVRPNLTRQGSRFTYMDSEEKMIDASIHNDEDGKFAQGRDVLETNVQYTPQTDIPKSEFLSDEERKNVGSKSDSPLHYAGTSVFATVGDIKRSHEGVRTLEDQESRKISDEMVMSSAHMEFAVSRALGRYRQRYLNSSLNDHCDDSSEELGTDVQSRNRDHGKVPDYYYNDEQFDHKMKDDRKIMGIEDSKVVENLSVPNSKINTHGYSRNSSRHQLSLEIPGFNIRNNENDEDNKSTHSYRSTSRVSSRRQSTEDSIDSEDEWYRHELRKLEELEKQNETLPEKSSCHHESGELTSFELDEDVKEKMSSVLEELRLKSRSFTNLSVSDNENGNLKNEVILEKNLIPVPSHGADFIVRDSIIVKDCFSHRDSNTDRRNLNLDDKYSNEVGERYYPHTLSEIQDEMSVSPRVTFEQSRSPVAENSFLRVKINDSQLSQSNSLNIESTENDAHGICDRDPDDSFIDEISEYRRNHIPPSEVMNEGQVIAQDTKFDVVYETPVKEDQLSPGLPSSRWKLLKALKERRAEEKLKEVENLQDSTFALQKSSHVSILVLSSK
ncbi:hypothetical protein QAD02_012810 [Eretmocerus hayati]|uniref:Uncharacterized protein n=1 Tax=Eretmocerus hayati TaxID=131215 RepID=A0ACC2P1N2_9HYME|nr:hypothetical protein QAD02_012810 [Eretmocerus hayati]